MQNVNIGIIGYGGFGQFLHNSWNQCEGIKVVAIADHHVEKNKKIKGAKNYTDWKEMILDDNIDVVAIVTQPHTHKELAIACMEAGKHVFVEKPLSLTLADAKVIMATRDKTGKEASINFIMRFNPLLKTIRTLTQDNVFGKLRRVDVENYAQDEQLSLEHWFWDIESSGGILIEHGVHFIDLIHYISPAEVVSVNGLKHNRNEQQEDQIMANVLYDDGLIATHYHSFSRPGFFEITKIKLAFDLADIELQGWIPLSGTVKILANAERKKALLANPYFKETNMTPIEEATDESRPKGWGIEEQSDDYDKKTIRSGGIFYTVDEIIEGTFQLPDSKQDVYKVCVQASMLDLAEKIRTPDHTLTAPLETGYESLKVAVLATQSARKVATTEGVSP